MTISTFLKTNIMQGTDADETVPLEGGCACPRPCSDVKTTGAAVKAAHDAQEAQEAQQGSGSQASRQIKCQLAEKAAQAARAAEAAFAGKLAMVQQLQYQVREAAAVVQEEAASCRQTQMQMQLALSAAAQAGQLLKTLTTALQMAQNTFLVSYQTAEGAKQELLQKAALVQAAKCRANALLKELAVAMQDLNTIRQAAYAAQVSATNAANIARSKRLIGQSRRRRRRRMTRK
ncbi:hypothetical protein RUM43_011191 [Polyplax serrata]|uniref:Uncharacterized protein n=1 Tax=Polyplax serrata TaxID=468196 RepID=A0AAN8PUB7_POLSC